MVCIPAQTEQAQTAQAQTGQAQTGQVRACRQQTSATTAAPEQERPREVKEGVSALMPFYVFACVAKSSHVVKFVPVALNTLVRDSEVFSGLSEGPLKGQETQETQDPLNPEEEVQTYSGSMLHRNQA